MLMSKIAGNRIIHIFTGDTTTLLEPPISESIETQIKIYWLFSSQGFTENYKNLSEHHYAIDRKATISEQFTWGCLVINQNLMEQTIEPQL